MMQITLGQQYNNVGEKPTVILYTFCCYYIIYIKHKENFWFCVKKVEKRRDIEMYWYIILRSK